MIFNQDAVYYAQLIREQKVSAVELVRGALEQVSLLNPALNAVTNLQTDSALKKAKQFDTQSARLSLNERNKLPPFYGVPILIKDLGQNQSGYIASSGAKLLRDFQPAETAAFVKSIEAAGFIIIGRTNVPEFGFKNISDSALHGPVNTPLDLARNAGGSSGGAAAALKAAMVPIVTASDGGGSIRIPASFNGLIGLKPTRGRMPVGPGQYRGWQGASINFALTKSVRDTWSLLKSMQVEQYNAPFILPKLKEKELVPLNKALRIAYTKRSPINQPLSNEAAEMMDQTMGKLESLGHELFEAEPAIDGIKAMQSYYIVNAVETAAMMQDIEQTIARSIVREDMELMSWALYQAGLKVSGVDYSKVLAHWDSMTAVSEAFFDDYDVMLMPTVNGPAPLHDAFKLNDALMEQLQQIDAYPFAKQQELIWEMFEKSLAWTPFTQQMNLTGQPAVSLPLYQTADGLPIGAQFSAPKGGEYVLLQLAQQLEAGNHLIIEVINK